MRLSRRKSFPVVIPEHIGRLCASRVFPVLQARGIECRQEGALWLSSILRSEDLWAWVAQLRVPSPGEVFEVPVPRHGACKIHDMTIWQDQRVVPDSKAMRVEVIRIVGSHVYCKPSTAQPCSEPPGLAYLLMLSNRLLTITAAPAPDRTILIADTIFANELVPMAFLAQRPARLIQAGQQGIQLHLLRKSELGFGTPCRHCHARGKVPCHVCGGTGRVNCNACNGTGYYTGKYGDQMRCGLCSGGSRDCHYCHGDCQINCRECINGAGYNPVTWDSSSGAFHAVESNQKRGLSAREPVSLVEWHTGKTTPLELKTPGFLKQLHADASGTASLTEERALRLADHARRLSLFEPLLEHLIERQSVAEQRPIPFRGIEASTGRRDRRVVYEFTLDRPKGAWVKEGVDPFPKGTRVLFVPRATSTWRHEIPLRWVEGFDPGPTGDRLEASYIRRKQSERGVRLLLGFPNAIDRQSIPTAGFLLASQPPPAEKAQLDHLRAWCGPNNRLNPVFQSVVFMDAEDSRPRKVSLYNMSIEKTLSQVDAVRWGCSESPLVLVKGPPGTGKTTVIVETIRQLANQGRKVLLCSQTHQAVRNVLERLHGEKRIRMNRHKSGSDDSLSQLERDYMAGAVADTFEKVTLDRARESFEAARRKWERDGAQLRALEAARDAAAELVEARKDLPHQHADVDVASDRRIEELETSAGNEKAEHRRQHDARKLQLETRLSSLIKERTWAISLVGCLRLRLERLGIQAEDDVCMAGVGDGKADIDASAATIAKRSREFSLKRVSHELREKSLGNLVRDLETELHALDEEKEAKTTHVEERTARAVAYVDARESERSLAVQEAATGDRRKLEDRHKRKRRDIGRRYKKLKAAARGKERKARKATEEANASLKRTTSKKESIAARYESFTGKKPRIGAVGERSWLKRNLPARWAGQEELLSRYSLLRKTERDLQAGKRKLRASLITAQAEFDGVVVAEEREVAAVSAACDEERGRVDETEKRVLDEIRTRAATWRDGVQAARDRRVQTATSEWEAKRAGKPGRLAALQDELCLESQLLGFLRDGMQRLESEIAKRKKAPSRANRRGHAGDDAIPDSQATRKEQVRRATESREDIASLLSREVYCHETEEVIQRDLRHNQDELAQRVRRIDSDLCEAIEEEEARRKERHTAVQATFDAIEKRCRKLQSDASAYTTRSMSDDEPPKKWEALAAPVRPAALRVKRKFKFLQRWVQDLSANASVVRRLHWDNIDVFLSTCVGVASWTDLKAGGRDAVDTVIIDEAAHATLPETLIPMLYGKRCVLIGDEMQLPPISMDEDLPPMPRESWIAESELGVDEANGVDPSSRTGVLVPPSENWLERSFFEWLYLHRPGLPRQMLDKQFRMHPDIAGFISEVFYPEGLHNGVSGEDRRLLFGDHTEAVCLRQTDTIAERHEQRVGKGFRNSCEADIVLQILEDAEQNLDIEGYREDLVSMIEARAASERSLWSDEKLEAAIASAKRALPSFGIITPYAHQKTLIQNALRRELPAFRNVDISPKDDVGSVDSYQGSERDVIVISFVRSPKKRPVPCRACKGKGRQGGQPCERCEGHGWEGANLSFVRDLRRLNVALSRAKRMLILVGDFESLVNPHYRGNDEGGVILDRLRNYIQSRGHVFVEHEAGYGR